MTTKTTYKVGDKVRILDAKKIWFGTRYWKDGDDTEVIRLLDDGRPCLSRNIEDLDERGLPLWSSELQYIELISPKPTKNQRLTSAEQAISTLEQKVEAMQAEIEALKAAQKPKSILSGEGTLIFDGKPIAKVSGISYKTMPPNEQASANEKRKAIIDEAKAFVEKYSGIVKYDTTPYTSESGDTTVKLFVNKEKGIVTAIPHLVHAKYTCHDDKKFAKCAPDDVFNEHIGKAIALGRALGLDVSKFEKAVQPTEFAVGQVTKGTCADTGKVTRIEEGRAYTERYTYWVEGSLSRGRAFIINDTEAQY